MRQVSHKDLLTCGNSTSPKWGKPHTCANLSVNPCLGRIDMSVPPRMVSVRTGKGRRLARCITRAPRKPGCQPIPPLREDGECFEWGIRLPGYSRIGWADSIPELVGILVGCPDYTDLSAKEQTYRRILRAVNLQCVTQARINLLSQTVRNDWEEACGWEREVLNGPRHIQPHGFESAAFFDGEDVWTCPIPLLLVRTAYAPYSDIEPVQGSGGNVWWIDPSTDTSMLDSLASDPLGVIQVWRLTPGD